MMPFNTELLIKSIRGTDKYKLTAPLVYESVNFQKAFIVPSDTETDFASIPRLVKFWLDDDGGFIRDAAVLHDYMYSKKSDKVYPWVTRKLADGLLIEGMKDLKASFAKQQAVYWALRVAGWAAYKK